MLYHPDATKSEFAYDELQRIIEAASDLLPEQAPLHFFVHHNTLHAFEHLPFEKAVKEASRILGSEPYLSEQSFLEALQNGRILPRDIERVIRDDSSACDELEISPGGITRKELRRRRLQNLFLPKAGKAVPWLLSETALLTAYHPNADVSGQFASRPAHQELPELWKILFEQSPTFHEYRRPPRLGDVLNFVTHVDIDNLVHPLLIRFSAAYLDQGLSYWRLPNREAGFFSAFVELFSSQYSLCESWQLGLSSKLETIRSRNIQPEEVIELCLTEIGLHDSQRKEYIEQSLLALRGWAGMMRQLEMRPDRMPVSAPRGSIVEYLAVKLLLSVHAAKYVMKNHFGRVLTYEELSESYLSEWRSENLLHFRYEFTYDAFLTAQICGIGSNILREADHAQKFLTEISQFDSCERRRLLHLSYEHRHRVQSLDSILAHESISAKCPSTSTYQGVFCIDDREESLRRHIEELCPQYDTYGYAGFFGVAMAYQGLDDIKPRPLCPVVVTPQHFVKEVYVHEAEYKKYLRAKKRIGSEQFAFTVGSKTLLRGAFFAQLFGLLAFIPLVLRCVAPRIYRKLSFLFTSSLLKSPATRLEIYREEGEEKNEGYYHGYTRREMSTIVLNALKTIGLTNDFAKIIYIVGHGSSSLNNPHCSAYDCGATGGGRGGANARAFAIMANDRQVRKLLQECSGIEIPDETYFIGSYHNTCDDSMTYYDEDLIPEEVLQAHLDGKSIMKSACLYDAHERCRKFDESPEELKLEEALKFAEQHANDLGEPRPEYGHATNALCIVGRRELTRGLFLDRRAFLVSYDPEIDPEGEILTNLLLAVGPVGAGINLEYYFSHIDPDKYGCGTKLPHNITGLLGIMDGHLSDLRTGLTWQMVEIHEPVRLLTVVEVEPQIAQRILDTNPPLNNLISNGWIQFAIKCPRENAIFVYRNDCFERYIPESELLPVCENSQSFYNKRREYLPCAHVMASLEY